VTAQETRKNVNPRERSKYEENFPAIVLLLLIAILPLIGVSATRGRVSAISLEIAKANNTLRIEEEKLGQLNYQLKEIQSLQRIEKEALALGLVRNNKTEVVVLAPTVIAPANEAIQTDAGPVEIQGAVTANLFSRLLDFLYGLLGG
jgi:cell division protein FtsL